MFPLRADVILVCKQAAVTAGCITHLAVLPAPDLAGVVWWTQQLWIIKCNNWITAHYTKVKNFISILIMCFENSNIVQLFGSNLQRQTPLPLARVPTFMNPKSNLQRHLYALSLPLHLLQYCSWHQLVHITFCPPYFWLCKRFWQLVICCAEVTLLVPSGPPLLLPYAKFI